MQMNRIRLTVVVLAAVLMTALAVPWVSAADPVPRAPSTSPGHLELSVFVFVPEEIRSTSRTGAPVCNPCTFAAAGYTHEIISPRDSASGLPTGKRQHKPMVISKRIDKSTPILYKALSTGATLPQVTVQVDQFSPDGDATPYFQYTLTNAAIADIVVSAGPGGAPMEEISFTYEKITWNHVTGGVTHEDTWSAQR